MTVTPTVAPHVEPRSSLWVRAPGVDLLGPYQGSGWTEPHYLVRRGDGQFAKLSGLLYRLLEETETPRAARDLHAVLGGEIEIDDVEQMLGTQLAPVGMVTRADGTAAVPMPTAEPIIALGLRGTVMPARLVQALARPLAHLFHLPAVALVVLTLLAGDVWLIRNADVVAGLDQIIATPLLALPLALISLAIPVLHELGHAAGCHHGGGRPGRIGFGVFIIWPALFTDVSDAYRLSRAARIRTDLGGMYFTVLGLLVVLAGYVVTGFHVLVLVLITLHIQAVQQLIPFVRTDGYYLLGDVAGVPNPFSSIGPVLRSALPGRPLDPQIAAMRPATRRIITAWTLMVVPFLALGLGVMLWFLPRSIPRWIDSVDAHLTTLVSSVQVPDLGSALYGGLSLLLLMIPIVGGLIVLTRITRALLRRIHRSSIGRHRRRPA